MPTMDDVFRDALGTRETAPQPAPGSGGSMDSVFSSHGASPTPSRPGPSLPAVAKAATLSPEEARRNQDLAAETGLPAKIVQADPDRAAKYAEARQLRKIEREAPATARFLTSPGNMELARDAAPALADMERQQQAAPRKPELTFDRFLRATGQSFLQALSDRAAGAALQEKAEFADYADVQAYQRRLASGPMPAFQGEARDAGELYWDMVKANEAQGMPQEEAETKAAREHNARYVKRFEDIAAAPGLQMDADLAAASSGIVEDIARGFSGSLLMMLSSAFGGPVIGTADAFTQMSGAKYKELRAAGADEATARKGAFLSALGQAPLEYAGNVLQFGAVAKLMKRSGVAGPLIESFAGNFVEEYLQAFPDAFADILAANPQLTARQLAREFIVATPDIAASPDTLYQGLVGGIVGTLVPGAVATVQVPFRLADNARNRGVADIKRAVQEAGSAAAAEDEAGYLDNLRQMAAENPLRERSPAKFEQALAMQIEEHPEAPRGIHIDGALFQQVISGDGGAYEDVLGQFGVTPDQVTEAVATGGDVTIPLAKYLAVAVDTPLDAALKDDIRLRPESMTLRERGEWLKSQAEETRRIVDAAAADRQAEDRIEAETRQIYDQVKAQREALGRATRTAGSDAAVWSAFLGTMARRGYLDQQFGGSPLKAFEAAWPELAGPQGPVEAAPRMAENEPAARAEVEAPAVQAAPAPVEQGQTPAVSGMSAENEGRTEEQAQALADYYATQLRSPREFHPILESVWGRISGKSLRADYPGEYKELTRAFGPSLFKANGLPIDEAGAELVRMGLLPEGSTDSDLLEKLKGLGTAWRRLKGGSRLFQRDPADLGPRGAFDRAGNILALFETANESTFLHESGHVFLEFTRALAMAEAADPRLKEEWQAFKAELGIQYDGEIDEAAHEKWARSLEAYFLEGKAPSRRLQGVFQRFAAWLRQIYGNLARLGSKPSAKLAGLFDRLLATDQEIAEVEAMHEAAQPFFTTAEQMAREERVAYERQVQAAQESARDRRLRRYVGAYVQALGGREAFQAEARRETETLPAYKAMDAAVAGGGMSAADLDAYVGEDARKELAKKRVGMVRTNGGEPPDQVARDAGFASVPDMVAAVLGAEGKTGRILRRAEELQAAKEAEIRAGLEEATLPSAEEDYHTDERLAVLAAEFEMLRAARRRKAGLTQARARRMEGDAVREVARQVLAGKSVSDARRADRFSQAEIRAGKLARQARDAGSLEKAMEFKRREMLNHALVLESMRVREEIDAGVRKVRQALASKVMYQEARDLIRDIGVRFGFAPRPPGMSHEQFVRAYNVTNAQADAQGTPRRAIDFTAWERLSGEKGYSVALPDLVTDRSNAQQFGDLSVQNFRDVLTAIDQIAAVDRQERFVKSEGEYRRREEVVRELTAQLAATFAPGKPGGRHERASSKIHKVLSALKGADASMVKMEVLFRAIDGDELGPWFRHLFLPTAQSEAAEGERCAAASSALAELMARHYGPAERAALFRKRVFVRECGESFTRAQLLRLALDMGNQGNYSRRRDGTTLPDGAPWSDKQMDAVKARLDKSDWDFVQAVWNYIDTFRKEAFALEREMTGREPERVMPEPVETPHGTYAGGYFPVVIDPSESDIQAERSEVEQALLYGTKKYSQVMTKHGYLKERKATAGGQPLSVELSDITRHVFGVIHDLSHRERLVNVGKILRDREFKAAAGRHLGKELADQLLPWAKDIANLPYEPHAWPERVFRSLRIGTTVVSLGKIGVGLQQAAGLTQSVAVLKGESWRLLKRLPGYFTVKPFLDDLRRANESSAFMRTRITHATREASETFRGVSLGGRLLRKPGEWMFKFIGATQKMTVDVLTWSAAYDAGLARDQDHVRAVQYADHVVRVSQGGGGLKDLSALQRSKSEFVKATTMFYSFLSTAYNLMAKPLRGRRIDFSEFALTTTMLALLGPSLAELLSGRPPEDDGEWDKWAAMNSLRFGLGMLPFVRDVASPVVSEFGGYKLTPVEGTIASATRLLSLASKGELLTDKAVSPALALTGAWLKLPTRQLEISARGAYGLLTGDPDFEPRDLIFKRSEN